MDDVIRAIRVDAKTAVAVGLLAVLTLLTTPLGTVQAQVVNVAIGAQNDPAVGVNGTATLALVNLYAAQGGYGMTFMLPIAELPLGGVDGGVINFQTKLNAAQNGVANVPGKYTGKVGGWSYVAAANSLPKNSITVTSYDVHGGADYVGVDGNLGANPRTAGFAVKLSNAPTNSHWIQVINDNDALFTNGTTHPGTVENHIDIGNTIATPYYDDGGAADTNNFFDAPRRPDVTSSMYWAADLYVASGPDATKNPGQVTLYNGVAYGWANIFVPANTVAAFKAIMNGNVLNNLGDLDSAVGAPSGTLDGFYETGTSNSADDPASLQTLDQEFNADLSQIPEPSSVLVLVGVAVPALMRRRIGKTV